MNRLRLLRYERGLEVNEVAERVGVSRQTMHRLESGETAEPSAATAKALADVYGVTVADLLGLDVPKDAAA